MVDFIPKIKVEIVVDAERTAQVIEAIQQAVKTEKIGDGKIFVLPVEEAIGVRTRERGKDAI